MSTLTGFVWFSLPSQSATIMALSQHLIYSLSLYGFSYDVYKTILQYLTTECCVVSDRAVYISLA